MNFLAHIYLSGEDNYIKFGNFIADWVKGKKYEAFPEKIKKGILLHREIDSFTDSHPIFRETTKKLRPFYKKHAGIVADILYDHFLASNWTEYSNVPLNRYAKDFYVILIKNYKYITSKAKRILPALSLLCRVVTTSAVIAWYPMSVVVKSVDPAVRFLMKSASWRSRVCVK